MTVPNHNMNSRHSITKPGISDHAGSHSFSAEMAPAISVNSVTEPKMGQGLP